MKMLKVNYLMLQISLVSVMLFVSFGLYFESQFKRRNQLMGQEGQ